MPPPLSDDRERTQDDSTREVMGQFLTVPEIAGVLKVPVSWIYERTRRRDQERIPHFKLGKYLRFDLAQVREWLRTLQEM
jgi:excisionase family DNA binding protein